METILLIDAKNLVSAAHFANWPNKGIVDDPDNLCVLETVLSTLTNLVVSMNPIEVVICADHPSGCDARRKIYPQYKGHRVKDPVSEDYKHRVCYGLRDILPCCWIEKEGYEADDLIARITEGYQKSHNIVIVSNDGDMFQLVQRFPDRVNVYDHIKKRFMSHEKFPHPIELMKGIVGDASDNIKSVTGEKTMLRIMEGEIGLDEVLDKGITISEKLPRREVFYRNLSLVSLIGKYAVLPKIDLSPIGICDSRDFCFPMMDEKLQQMMPEKHCGGGFSWILSNWENWWNLRDVRLHKRGVISWPPAQKSVSLT